MARQQAAGSFELRVEFSGISLYVRDPGRLKIGFVMPDARYLGRRHQHLDGTGAAAHVGYLRFDLANLASDIRDIPARGPGETPGYEVVHLFDREALDFGLPATDEPIDAANLALPNFDDFAPVLMPRPGLFAGPPPPEALMRTVLTGGTLMSIVQAGLQWELSGELHPAGRTFVYTLGGDVRWRRTVNAPGLTLRVERFEGGGVTTIPLRPTTARGDQPAISLKIANLCAPNPLEWGTFEPVDAAIPDTDFKWLYRLLQPRPGDIGVRYPPAEFPHPKPQPSRNMMIIDDCFGAMITEAF